MNTHVFIVDSITLKNHIEYLFAGTGAKDHVIDFNNICIIWKNFTNTVIDSELPILSAQRIFLKSDAAHKP